MFKKIVGIATGAIAMLAIATPALTEEAQKKDEVFKLKTVIQVPGFPLVSFDISWVDPVLKKYFLADRSNKSIEVVDVATHDITQHVNAGFAGVNSKGNDFSGPDGVATVNRHTELWVGDSPGKVWVFDSTNLAVKSLPGGATNPILVGGTTRADEFCTDPRNHVFMITSPGEDPPFVTFISTTTYKVVGKLVFDGTGGTPKATNGLEQCGWSPTTGKFYQNVPEVNGPGDDTAPGAVAVINPQTMKVETSFLVPLDACAGPQGLAIGPHNQILLGCNAKSPNGHRNIAVINEHSGAVLAIIPDLGGADEVWFNEGDGHYLTASCNTACRTIGTGASELLGVVDSDGLRVDRSFTVATQNQVTAPPPPPNPRTIHSVAADSNTNQVFLPIPAVGGNAPQFGFVLNEGGSSLCDARGAGITVIGVPSSATGCIAVLAAKHDNLEARRHRDDEDEMAEMTGSRN